MKFLRKKIIKYIWYFLALIFLIIILFYVISIFIGKSGYLHTNLPEEAKPFIGKFKVIEDPIEMKYFNKNDSIDTGPYKIQKNKNINDIISFKESSVKSEIYGECKSGYFKLNSVFKKSICDEKIDNDFTCHSIFNTEYPIYFLNFNCYSNGPSYNLFMLKNKNKKILWLMDEGFYFKLERIE